MEEEIKFEKALDQLEKIVEALEAGDLTLDEALKRYEEGVKLSRACTKKLGEAEKKIETLTRQLNDFSDSEVEMEDASKSKKAEKKKTKRPESDLGDELLL